MVGIVLLLGELENGNIINEELLGFRGLLGRETGLLFGIPCVRMYEYK